MKKNKYYTTKRIDETHARYRMIYGERSSGKTYSVLEGGLREYFDSGEKNQTAIIRRYAEDFIGSTSAKTAYENLMCNGEGKNVVHELSKGKYVGIEYFSGAYYFTAQDDDGNIKRTKNIIAYGFALTKAEHYKMAAFPRITRILFDEFITRKPYLVNEFIDFTSVLSTIIRKRDNVIIYMCANTVNKYGCPYFREMGLYRAKEQEQDTVDVYDYGKSGLRVALEWTENSSTKTPNPSDVYFAFDNPRLQMITTGAWEIASYPHCPVKYIPNEIKFIYFIKYDEQLLQCEIVQHNDDLFTFIHRKTTPLQTPERDLIFDTEYNSRINYRRRITETCDTVGKRIMWFYEHEKVFYQDNDVGEVVRSYLGWCRTKSRD
nr:MAG TPA: Terminase [Caudoviricetes sp.]